MIYLKNLPNDILNIEDLLSYGFTNYQFAPTFYDKECTLLQCRSANRSFEDLLEICKTYFPNTTEVDLAKTLFNLNKKIRLHSLFCIDINKVVFYKGYDSADLLSNYYYEDFDINTEDYEDVLDEEFFTKGDSPYSMADICKLADINY